MPIYELRCTECGYDHEAFRSHSEHGTWSPCPQCEGKVRQVISRPMSVHVDNMPSYICPATGERITSRTKRRENFARHGLMDANELGEASGPVNNQPLESVDLGGELGMGADLSQEPVNMPKMSRRDEERLVEDIKQAIEEQP